MSVAAWHWRLAVLYALTGMGVGIYMGITHDHTLGDAHAHVNLVGWASTALYGAFCRLYDVRGTLAWVHFAIAHAGAVVLSFGIGLIMLAHPAGDPVAAVGSIVTIAGMLLFAGIVYRRTAAEPAR